MADLTFLDEKSGDVLRPATATERRADVSVDGLEGRKAAIRAGLELAAHKAAEALA